MFSCVTFVFLAIVLFTFFAVTPLEPAITGVTRSTAASVPARTAGTTQRPGPSLRIRINPSLWLSRPDTDARRHLCRRFGGQQHARGALVVLELAQIRQLLLQLEHRFEQVAFPVDPLDRGRDLEADLLGIAALR